LEKSLIRRSNYPLSGKAKGMVVLSMSRDSALGTAGTMLGIQPKEINADVAAYAVGELTNKTRSPVQLKPNLSNWK
jgi:CheY-specific phosphatase CheX